MDTYGMNADCTNCGHHSTAQIPRGTPVADYKGECPNCGVAAVKVRKTTPITPVPQPYPVRYVPYRPPYPWWQVWSTGGTNATSSTNRRLPEDVKLYPTN